MTATKIFINPRLYLPDGRDCNELGRFELAHILIGLGVPDILPDCSKQEALVRYRDFQNKKPDAPDYSAQTQANEMATSFRGDAA